MRLLLIATAVATLASGGVLAQSTAGGERPVDQGPTTPDANSAYQGGGVVLEGAPGAPPPPAKATPPGQAPDDVVPK